MVFLKSDGGEAPLSWDVNSGLLPPGLEFTSAGLIRGIPQKAGEYSFGLSVTDAAGRKAEETFEIDFVDPLLVETSLIPDLTIGLPFELQLQGSGGTLPYQWEILDGVLPPGVTLGPNGYISGSADSPKATNLLVSVIDSSGLSTQKELSLNFVESLIIRTESIETAVSGTNYSFEFDASGGTPPYLWEISDGELPEGMVLSSDGQISGLAEFVGNTRISAKVTDSANRTASFPYIFSVSIGGERQIIKARGGTVTVDIRGNDIIYIENSPNDGFKGYLITPGPEKVQFHFIDSQGGQVPSWVLCERNLPGICSFD
ncbi:MAG: hypothetical protein CMB18_00035 [Euryarchaeota archaeon]|nr:hypothetical protein [Euryarchaeota archaeon]